MDVQKEKEEIKKDAELVAKVMLEEDIFPVEVDLEEFLKIDLEELVTEEMGITDPIGQVIKSIEDFITSTASWIAERVSDAFSYFYDTTIKPVLDGLGVNISNILTDVGKVISDISRLFTYIEDLGSNIINIIKANVETIVSKIWELIRPLQDTIYRIPDLISGLWSGIQKSLSGVIATITASFSKVFDYLKNIGASISGLMQMFWKGLEWLGARISEFLKPLIEVVSKIPDQLSGLWKWLSEQFISLGERIRGGFEWFGSLLSEWAGKITSAISELFKHLTTLGKYIQDFGALVLGGFTNLLRIPEMLWQLMPDWLKGFFESVRGFFESMYKGLLDFWKDPVGFIQARLQEFSKWIWDNLPPELKWIIQNVKGALEGAWETIVNFFTKDVPNFFKWLWEGVQEFTKDPLKFLQEKLVTPLMSGLTWLGEQIYNAISSAINTLMSWVRGLSETFINISKDISGAILNLGAGFTGSLATLGESIASAISGTVQSLLSKFIDPVKSKIAEVFKNTFTGKGGEVEAIFGVSIAMIPSFLTVMMLPKTFKSLSHIVKEFRLRIEGSLAPLGAGGRFILNILTSLPRVLYELGDAMEKVAPKMGESFITAFTLMGLEPIRYPFRFVWKQYFDSLGLKDIPFEIPPLEMTRRLVQRLGIEKVKDKYKDILTYRGFPSWFIENYVKLPEELNIQITDRFGTRRLIPLALLYEQPSLSDLCTMMIRDIFGAGAKGLEEFTKWGERLGLYKDIAYLYYLLHYKYPSPEKLWEFTTRGMAGLIWYSPTKAELDSAVSEARGLGAYTPIIPVTLNFDNTKLLSALSNYMKWHDYARFSWLPNFTSDNWLIIDTLADIPTKIDTRWMVKWGIFDFMIEKGVKTDSPASAFLTILEDRALNPKVFMDLTIPSRLLLARGLHPYFVPAVVVAETINAVADERTYLRTGIVNLYEYGSMTFRTIDSLMANLVTASFKVAVPNLAGKGLIEKYVNVPIMYLPMERKLIELRAVIDRYLRIYRDTLNDLEKAYTEYIINSNDVQARISKIVEVINNPFKKATVEISGREFAMEVDADFINAVLESWAVARDIYTIRRIRSWVYRALGWVIYRTAYGWVTKEDAIRVARVLSRIARLPETEAKAVEEVLTTMVGIARRERGSEYIPTPSMLATISEIIPEARKFINDVLKARNVPPEWWEIWHRYIMIKPIASDVKRYVERVIDLYEYFIIDEKALNDALQLLAKVGYETIELEMIKDYADASRTLRAWRELVGTPKGLVTMAEYSPRARRIALSMVDKMIDALPVDPATKRFLKEMWYEYIRVKPVYDEVRREASELVTDYANGVISYEDFKKFLNELKKWGLDDYEIEFYLELGLLRRMRYMARRRVGGG